MRVNKHSELWRQFWIQTAMSLTASNMRFSGEVTGVRTVLKSPCTMLWIATLLSRNLNVTVQRNPSSPKLRSRRPKHYLQGRQRPRCRMKRSNTEAVTDIDWMKERPNVKGLISCFSHVKWLMHDSFTNTVSRLKSSYNFFSSCRISYNRILSQVLFPDIRFYLLSRHYFPCSHAGKTAYSWNCTVQELYWNTHSHHRYD